MLDSFVTPLRHVDFFVDAAVPCAGSGGLPGALVFPGGDVGEIFVVALGFAVRRLILLAEMAAAGFVARAARRGTAIRRTP